MSQVRELSYKCVEAVQRGMELQRQELKIQLNWSTHHPRASGSKVKGSRNRRETLLTLTQRAGPARWSRRLFLKSSELR